MTTPWSSLHQPKGDSNATTTYEETLNGVTIVYAPFPADDDEALANRSPGREVVRAPAGQAVTAPALSLFHPGDNAATVVMV